MDNILNIINNPLTTTQHNVITGLSLLGDNVSKHLVENDFRYYGRHLSREIILRIQENRLENS